MSKQEMQNIIVDYLMNFQPQVIGIFGTYSRNEQTSRSDLDIFIRFSASPSLLQLIRIENELSEKLNIKVDLVTEGSIRNERIKNAIQKDLQIIYRAWRMIQDYMGVDVDVIWKTIEIDLPELDQLLRKIKS